MTSNSKKNITLRSQILAFAFVSVWATSSAILYFKINSYSHTPGEASKSEELWPSESSLSLDPQKDTLLVFVHPKCSCSKATLAELNRLLPHIQEKVSVIVIFDHPKSKSDLWYQGNNWEIAKNLPGIRVWIDRESKEITRFKVFTSGQVLLYSNTGKRLFAGGITAARSHEGDSLGRSIILERVRSGNIKQNHSPVFGCKTSL